MNTLLRLLRDRRRRLQNKRAAGTLARIDARRGARHAQAGPTVGGGAWGVGAFGVGAWGGGDGGGGWGGGGCDGGGGGGGG